MEISFRSPNDDHLSRQSRISFDARARQTYYIMVGAWDSGPGGNLILDAIESQLYIRVALERGGSVELQSGTAWITGIVTCKGFDYATVTARLSQRTRHDIVTGSGFSGGRCDEDGASFTVQINPTTASSPAVEPKRSSQPMIATLLARAIESHKM